MLFSLAQLHETPQLDSKTKDLKHHAFVSMSLTLLLVQGEMEKQSNICICGNECHKGGRGGRDRGHQNILEHNIKWFMRPNILCFHAAAAVFKTQGARSSTSSIVMHHVYNSYNSMPAPPFTIHYYSPETC